LFAQLVSKIFNLCGPDPPTSQTDGRTDGQTTCDRKTALCTIVHRAVKNDPHYLGQWLIQQPYSRTAVISLTDHFSGLTKYRRT